MNRDKIQLAAVAAMKRMDESYDPRKSKTVFDEVLLVSLHGTTLRLDWHQSTRSSEEIRASFRQDFERIRSEIIGNEHLAGDFHFDTEAEGSIFDAFICLGNRQYLVFNNIALSMKEVKGHGDWIAAQSHFATLAAKFEVNAFDEE